MREGMFDIQHNGYVTRTIRVDKRKASKAYAKGITVYMMACKLAPSWVFPAYPATIGNLDHADFDQVVCNFEYYNCTYETGYYASYYIFIGAAKTL